jgi:DNA-binding Lrp family transcriptional regulator
MGFNGHGRGAGKMSKELTASDAELADLLQSVVQELSLYDSLFPKVEDKELQVLLGLIRIYLAKCDNPGLKQEHMLVSPEVMKRLSLFYFDPFSTPVNRSLREALVSRLNSIRKYNIGRPEVVRRTLITCLFAQEEKSYTKQKKYLDAFMRNPGKGFKEIAKQLGVTPQATYKAYHHLQKTGMVWFNGYLNYPMFKLKHFAVFFTLMREYKGKNDYLRRVLFESLPFALGLNLDVHEGNSWASYVIPNQKEALHEFKGSLNQLKGELFREIEVRELRSCSTGSNLEFFDGKRWFFDPQLWAYGFFEFAQENKELLRKPTVMKYSDEAMRFDRKDVLIAAMLSTNLLYSHAEISKLLKQYGYDLSRASVTRRIERLVAPATQSGNGENERQLAVYPITVYQGLGLKSLSVYLIECRPELVEEIHYAVGYLPYYYLYTTDKGVLLVIKSALEDVGNINYVIRGINEISIIAYSNRFENIGTRNITRLHDRWDERSQKWICRAHEFNFVKHYESTPD